MQIIEIKIIIKSEMRRRFLNDKNLNVTRYDDSKQANNFRSHYGMERVICWLIRHR